MDTVVCNGCKNIYVVNIEFCGDPEEVNACPHCGKHDYESWCPTKRKCPKCDNQVSILKEANFFI